MYSRYRSKRSQVRDAAFRSAGDELAVLVERTRRRFQRRRLPRRSTLFPLGVGDIRRVDGANFGINFDDITVLDQTDVTTNLRFRRNVTDDETVRATGESTIRDERAVVPETGTHDGRRRREHLRHARTTLRTFVANDDDATLERLGVCRQGLEHFLFAIVALREAFKVQAFLTGDLRHGASLGDVAVQALQVTSLLDGRAHRENNILPRRQIRADGEVLGEGLTGDSHARTVNHAFRHQILQHRRSAANLVDVLHDVLTGRL